MPSLSLALSPSIPQGGWKRGPALSSSPTSPRDPHSCCSSSQVWGRDPQHPPAPCLCSATKLLCSQPLQMALKSLTVCPGRLTSSPNPLTDMQHSRGPPPRCRCRPDLGLHPDDHQQAWGRGLVLLQGLVLSVSSAALVEKQCSVVT